MSSALPSVRTDHSRLNDATMAKHRVRMAHTSNIVWHDCHEVSTPTKKRKTRQEKLNFYRRSR